MSRLVMDYLAPSPPPPLEQRLLHHAQLCFDHQELDLAFVHAVTAAEMLIYAGIAVIAAWLTSGRTCTRCGRTVH